MDAFYEAEVVARAISVMAPAHIGQRVFDALCRQRDMNESVGSALETPEFCRLGGRRETRAVRAANARKDEAIAQLLRVMTMPEPQPMPQPQPAIMPTLLWLSIMDAVRQLTEADAVDCIDAVRRFLRERVPDRLELADRLRDDWRTGMEDDARADT